MSGPFAFADQAGWNGSLLALLLREALETPDRTAALVAPDQALARRVAAKLARWGRDPRQLSG